MIRIDTMKEEIVCGRVFRSINELSQAMLDFRDTYTRSWRLEKLGFMMSLEARRCYENERLQPAAA